jgi:myo-inositol-1(or 4)-monophosphatase
MEMQNNYSEFLATAVDTVKAAGQLALSMQTRLKDIHFKGEKDIVTEADFACDAAIRKALTMAYPSHNLITEEAAALQLGSEFTWFVDPIDGTVNYSRGFPLWGVSAGLRQGDEMIAGAIYLPALDEMYSVSLGGGAFLNGQAIHTSSVMNLHEAIISHGDFNIGSTDDEREQFNSRNLLARGRTATAVQRIKCMGSAVLEGAFVAAGRMEAYCMLAMKPWDVAVAGLLVTEAGGKVSQLNGDTYAVEGPDVLFSNGHLHMDLLKILGNT